jgi:pyruvate-ferredoxin/flavodoxin oxidoreductase
VKDKSEARRKALGMAPLAPRREAELARWDFFERLGDADRGALHLNQVKDVQLLKPLFEFSGACAGCGETPYLKLLSQLVGDRLLVANATGCSSIYGGSLPATPWTTDAAGRGPAWANSLFEDNAEFGLGLKLAHDHRAAHARRLLGALAPRLGDDLVQALAGADQASEAGLAAQRERVAVLRARLAALDDPRARELESVAEALVRASVWIVGGDGWAYDIGYGGLDHVLASGEDVNVLVLDTEVYSNTGGQMSKATPRAAVAKFAAGGKAAAKKDLGLLAMTYGTIYVAAIAMGADDPHTLRVFREAEAYPGPSLVIAYSHCIAHGYDLVHGLDQQRAAVASGAWLLYRFDPRRAAEGKPALEIDSKPPTLPLRDYAYNETRFTMLAHADPVAARAALRRAEDDVRRRRRLYERLAGPVEGGT